MYFSYTKYNNQTIVECYFPYGIISIFVWILLLVILLGFVLIPLIILLRYLLTKRNIKKIEENYERVFDYKNINSLNNQHNFSSPVNYNPLNNNLVNSDSKSIPPPFKGSHPNITPPPIHQDSIANKSIPPPIPRKTDYFIVFQGVQKGPLDINTLKEMIALKMIEENTLFWTEGMNDWKSIKEINLN